MDLKNALHIFNTLYSDLNGYALSTQGKNAISTKDKAFTYGEVSPKEFNSIIKEVPMNTEGIFYDLGSGTGKAVLLASLLFKFSESIGIELLNELHTAAEGVMNRYEYEFKDSLPDNKKNQLITLIHESFLEYDFSDADVIFVHSTCFPETLMEELAKKFKSLKKDSVVITVTKTVNASYLKRLKSKEFSMNWGQATVHYYKKI